MNAEAELLQAYREWHRLARAETKAIRTRNWDLLADCQLAIADFQTLITRLSREARAEWEKAGVDCAEKERHIQIFVNDLLTVTCENRSLLQVCRDEAAQKLQQLGEAGRKVKLLHRSYGSPGAYGFAT